MSSPYTFYKYTVAKMTWYKMGVKVHPSTKLKQGTLKLINAKDKLPIMPLIKLPNILFTPNKKASSIEEMEKYDSFDIVFFSGQFPLIYVYATNLKIISMTIRDIKPLQLKKEVDLWKFRRQFDLEFLNYYLTVTPEGTTRDAKHSSINFENFNPPDFLDRFTAEYKLYKNPNYLNAFAQNLDLNLLLNQNNNKIMYLVQLSSQFETSSYTERTQNLLNSFNKIVDKDKEIIGVTRYGYPYDRSKDYYDNNKISNKIDQVTYLKLLGKQENLKDNFNNNNIIDYLKKYIIESIRMANNLGAKIIHSCSNFYNGIACVYAGKYLGIKTIYEIRSLWEFDNRFDLYDSDVLRMRRNLEDIVINKVDAIIVTNDLVKQELVSKRSVDSNKIFVISNGYNNIHDNKETCRKELGIEWDLVIGYVGNIEKNNKLNNLLEALREIKIIGINAGMFLLGSGNLDLGDMSSYVKIINLDETKQGKYIHTFDIAIYPKLLVLAHGIPSLSEDDNTYSMKITKKLSQEILELYQNQGAQEKLKLNTMEYMNSHSWDISAGQLKDLYAKLLDT